MARQFLTTTSTSYNYDKRKINIKRTEGTCIEHIENVSDKVYHINYVRSDRVDKQRCLQRLC